MQLEYPQVVQIETTTACNAKCPFCPHNSMHEHGRMDAGLFMKMVDEMSGWPTPPTTVCPFLTNEPFADPRQLEWCRTLEQRLPKTTLTFFTNGSLLTPERREELASLKRVNMVMVSLHSFDHDEYREMMGLDLATTLKRVKALRGDYPAVPMQLLRVAAGTAEDQRFMKECMVHFPGVPVTLATRWNWKGTIPSHERELVQNIVCPRSRHLTVRWNGVVGLCCMDELAQYPRGDATKQTLLEIYNGPVATKHRTMLKRDLEPCNRCNMR